MTDTSSAMAALFLAATLVARATSSRMVAMSSSRALRAASGHGKSFEMVKSADYSNAPRRCCARQGRNNNGAEAPFKVTPPQTSTSVRLQASRCASSRCTATGPTGPAHLHVAEHALGCGIMAVKRPSAVVTAVRPPALPLGLNGYCRSRGRGCPRSAWRQWPCRRCPGT